MRGSFSPELAQDGLPLRNTAHPCLPDEGASCTLVWMHHQDSTRTHAGPLPESLLVPPHWCPRQTPRWAPMGYPYDPFRECHPTATTHKASEVRVLLMVIKEGKPAITAWRRWSQVGLCEVH